jgi:hypothetical protein
MTPRLNTRKILVAILAMVASACSSTSGTSPSKPGRDAGGASDGSTADASEPPPSDAGEGDGASYVNPLAGVKRNSTWQFVPFTGAYCINGSTTGIGVNFTTASSDLLVYLQPGGGCWDEATCMGACAINVTTGYSTSAGTPAWKTWVGTSTGTIFDRGDTNNPFKNFNYVSVFYCTADTHAGTRVDTSFTIPGPSGSAVHPHFVGYQNLETYLTALKATFPHPGKLVLAGQSAGGFGSYLDYDLVASRFPGQPLYMIDDSGPVLPNSDNPTGAGHSYAAWGVVVPSGCSTCMSDAGNLGLSSLATYLSTTYPDGRMALLSSLQDEEIRQRYELDGSSYAAALTAYASDVLAKAPDKNWRYFLVAGDTHTMLVDTHAIAKDTSCGLGVTSVTTPPGTNCGPTLETFLDEEVNGSLADWSSVIAPPGVPGTDMAPKNDSACSLSQ